ncbi:hypothetical protein Tco_1237185 [Tanacetum coccineum]
MKGKNPEQSMQRQKAKTIAPEIICVFYYSKGKAKSKTEAAIYRERRKRHDGWESTFKFSTDKLAWQILDWGDMMRSGVTTRTLEKLVCRRTYQLGDEGSRSKGTELIQIFIKAEREKVREREMVGRELEKI